MPVLHWNVPRNFSQKKARLFKTSFLKLQKPTHSLPITPHRPTPHYHTLHLHNPSPNPTNTAHTNTYQMSSVQAFRMCLLKHQTMFWTRAWAHESGTSGEPYWRIVFDIPPGEVIFDTPQARYCAEKACFFLNLYIKHESPTNLHASVFNMLQRIHVWKQQVYRRFPQGPIRVCDTNDGKSDLNIRVCDTNDGQSDLQFLFDEDVIQQQDHPVFDVMGQPPQEDPPSGWVSLTEVCPSFLK